MPVDRKRLGRGLYLLLMVWLVACAAPGGPSGPNSGTSPTPASPLPTWTPTSTPLAPSSFPTSTPSPYARPVPTRPQGHPSPTPSPFPGRIDAAGPLPIPTVQPLPPGSGRSPVRLRIPALALDVPVEPMGWHEEAGPTGVRTVWDVPLRAAGHHIDSAFPGEAGNVVISGHHNMGAAVFAKLSTIGEPNTPLQLGDEILLVDALGREFTYRITGWRRFPEPHASLALRKENAAYLAPTTFPQLTLITCWPAHTNTHRVIVTAVLTHITYHETTR